ncbi:unnamed protein product [Thlaspi arvense]|uniref:Reverse transcriptase zinc-binding domain-containing protein n=1 Tax=Thlaspi arvense TaxID=13288 RepID=A0AAU9RAB9_THLAR|nr:unnamed protein product [Thlaspi arvense]
MRVIPLVEKQLWKNLWKANTSPKIRHFVWKATSGALAAKEAWEISQFPAPPSGWSPTSVFLNFHHLLSHSKKTEIPAEMHWFSRIPIYQLQKSRVCYSRNQSYNKCSNPVEKTSTRHPQMQYWIILDQSEKEEWRCMYFKGSQWDGPTTFSAQAYAREAKLQCMVWAVQELSHLRQRRVIFEGSLPLAREALLHLEHFPLLHSNINLILSSLAPFEFWSLDHITEEANQAAVTITVRVTRDHRYQSYVAAQGPFWLHKTISLEANVALT